MRVSVIPKGKAKKQSKYADYRTSLCALILERFSLDDPGSCSEIKYMDCQNIKVNNKAVENEYAPVKPGDIVSVRFWNGQTEWWENITVTAKMIEDSW